MSSVIVLGGGVIGLGTAMLLAKDGHAVTVLERDPALPVASPDEAWRDWERTGVNQFRLPHFFLSRFRALLDAELPEAAEAAASLGALRFNPLLDIPESVRGPVQDDDHDVEVLTARRPVMELALATAAAQVDGLVVRRGTPVAGLLVDRDHGSLPRVRGVRTESGDVHEADLVVDALGRRSPLPRWLEDVDLAGPREEVEDSGFMYFARHFRSPDGSYPVAFGGGLMHFGTISTLLLYADNGTWGVGLITSAKDRALWGLKDPERWTAVMRSLPLAGHWLDGEPIDDRVVVMSKLEDRLRDYRSPDGSPSVTGLVSIADAWACSNPSLGRGASIGLLHGTALRDTMREVPDDPTGLVASFAEVTDRSLLPWFEWTRTTDRHRIAHVDAMIEGKDYEPGDDAFELEQSVTSASSKDPDLLRVQIRGAMLLERPEEAIERRGLADRLASLGSGWRDDPVLAPSRDELVQLASA